MVEIRTYRPKENVSLRDLMIRKIGAGKDECIYLGEIVRGTSKCDCYHCFSTTVFVDSDISIVGESNEIYESRKRLDSFLNIELVDWIKK